MRRRNALAALGYALFEADVNDLKDDGLSFCREVAALIKPGPEV